MCCCCAPSPTNQVLNVEPQLSSNERSARDDLATGVALFCISCVLIALAVGLVKGVAALPPETTMGFGMVYSFAGYFIGAIGVVVFVGVPIHLILAAVGYNRT